MKHGQDVLGEGIQFLSQLTAIGGRTVKELSFAMDRNESLIYSRVFTNRTAGHIVRINGNEKPALYKITAEGRAALAVLEAKRDTPVLSVRAIKRQAALEKNSVGWSFKPAKPAFARTPDVLPSHHPILACWALSRGQGAPA